MNPPSGNRVLFGPGSIGKMKPDKFEISSGFAVVPDLLTTAEVESVRNHVRDIESVGTRCLLNHRWCCEWASKLRRRLASLVPHAVPAMESLAAVQCTYFNKAKRSNWFVGYHQDRSVPVDQATPATRPGWSQKEGLTFIQPAFDVMAGMLAVRLHLDDSGEDNGPLCVLPGTHVDGILSSSAIREYHQRVSPQTLLCPAGGVVLMRPMLLHASPKSRVNSDRRVLHFLFGPRNLPNEVQWHQAV